MNRRGKLYKDIKNCHPEGFIPEGSKDSSDTICYCPQNDEIIIFDILKPVKQNHVNLSLGFFCACDPFITFQGF